MHNAAAAQDTQAHIQAGEELLQQLLRGCVQRLQDAEITRCKAHLLFGMQHHV